MNRRTEDSLDRLEIPEVKEVLPERVISMAAAVGDEKLEQEVTELMSSEEITLADPACSVESSTERCCDIEHAQLNGGLSPRRIQSNLRHLAWQLCSRRDKPEAESHSARHRRNFAVI